MHSPSAAAGVAMNQPQVSNYNYAYDIESSPATSGFISTNTVAKNKNSVYGRSSLNLTQRSKPINNAFQNMSIKTGEKKNKINLPSFKKGLRLFNLRKSSDESSKNDKKLAKKKPSMHNLTQISESKMRSLADQEMSYLFNEKQRDFQFEAENIPPHYDNCDREEFMDYTAVIPPAPKVFKTRSKKKVEQAIKEHTLLREQQNPESSTPRADPVAEHCQVNNLQNHIEFQEDKDIYQKSIHKVQQWLISIPDDMTRFSILIV